MESARHDGRGQQTGSKRPTIGFAHQAGIRRPGPRETRGLSSVLSRTSAYLGQSVAATRKLCERRKVPPYRDGPGAKVWLRRSELDAYIEANRA